MIVLKTTSIRSSSAASLIRLDNNLVVIIDDVDGAPAADDNHVQDANKHSSLHACEILYCPG